MPVTKEEKEKLMKTAALIGAANLALAPVYMENRQAGVASSLALTGGLLLFLHAQGEQKKQKEETPIGSLFSLFSKNTHGHDNKMEPAFNHILDGGEQAYDQVIDLFKLAQK